MPVGTQTCGGGSTGWLGWCRRSFIRIHSKTRFSCFAGGGKTGSKGWYWEGDGFVLVYKRLESGSFQWPRNGEEARQLTAQQYRWLMEGLSVEQPKAHRPVSGLNIV